MADQTVPMISPDGKDVADVPADQVEHFKSLGAKIVEPPPPPSLGRRLAKGALDSLPGIGGVVGGVISTPETGGAATIPGIALGAGVGRGVRDVIGHLTGLDEPTTPLEKAAHIALDTGGTAATAAIMPGAVAAVKAPLQTLREGTEQFSAAMPASVRKILDLFPSLPKASGPILERPGWQTWGEPPTAPAGGLSATDKALLAKMGYKDAQIAQVEQELLKARSASPPAVQPPTGTPPKYPIRPQPEAGQRIVPETGETEAAWRARVAARIAADGGSANARPPITVSPSSPMQPPSGDSPIAQQLKASLAARQPSAPSPVAPIRAVEGRPAPLYASPGGVKGATSNALEAASNAALAAGHYDEAERLIGQSLQSFFQGSGGPMAGILAAAIAHKARQIVEPLRADPSFQAAPPARQQQLIQNALRQPGARGSLTSLLGS